jgi:hypothetical protein
MLTAAMSNPFQRALRVLLALVLGLGPLSAAVLAAGLHASLCACPGCDAQGAPDACCREEPRADADSTRVADEGCPCVLELPESDRVPAVAPDVGGAAREVRVELARAQRAVELAWSVTPGPSRSAPAAESPPVVAVRLPGSRDAHGGVRAAALATLRL